MIVDSFLFLNELDLLEIRLNCLSKYVDMFVLCESPVTFTGNLKPLNFYNNRDRFSKFNIKHVVADNGTVEWVNKNQGEAWHREYYQRKFLVEKAIEDMGDDDILLMSDCDEFPDLGTYKGEEGVFVSKLYYYYFNCYSGNRNWPGSLAIKKRNVGDPNKLRDRKKRLHRIGRGWHFSYVCSPENLVYKIESFSHWDVNTPEKKAGILENRKNLCDPYNRVWVGRDRPKTFRIEMPSGPKWLIDNQYKYRQYFYDYNTRPTS